MPFGDVRTDPDTIDETDFGYTGQGGIEESELMDYKARFYGPGFGRMTQPDTIIPNPGNPQSLNRYSYTLNNPIRYTDPTGHRICEDLDYCEPPASPSPSPPPPPSPSPAPGGENEDEGNTAGSDAGDGGSGNDCEESQDPQACEEFLQLLDQLFDPYYGSLGLEGSSSYEWEQNIIIYADIYIWLGIDLGEIAGFGVSNPLSFDAFLTAGNEYGGFYIGGITQPGRWSHEPYNQFLQQAGVNTGINLTDDSLMNFEPNFLAAMMRKNPGALQDAKDILANAILTNHGGDYSIAIDYPYTSFSPVGAE